MLYSEFSIRVFECMISVACFIVYLLAMGTSLEVHDNSDKAHGLRFEVRAQPDVGPPSD